MFLKSLILLIFFEVFDISRGTEIMIESSFSLEMYVPYILEKLY